jgi:hypothetical protein
MSRTWKGYNGKSEKEGKDVFRHIFPAIRKTKSYLKNLLSIIKKKWYISAIPFLMLFVFFGTCGSREDYNEISSYDIAAISFLNLYLLSVLKVILILIENDTTKSQKQNIPLKIEGFWRKVFPTIAPTILVSIIFHRNSISGIISCILAYLFILILGVYVVSLPLVVLNKIQRIFKKKKEENFLLWLRNLVFEGPIEIPILVIFVFALIFVNTFFWNILIFLLLFFFLVVFPLSLCPPVLNFLLKVMYRIIKGLYYLVELEDIHSKFKINLKSKERYGLPDVHLFWHFFIGMFPFFILCLIVYTSNIETVDTIKEIGLFFVITLTFFVFLPLYASIFFLSLLGLSWGEKKIRISIFYKYFAFLTILLSITGINQEDLWLEFFGSSSYLYSFILGVSIGFTLLRRYIANKIESYFSDPKFEEPLDYLIVEK